MSSYDWKTGSGDEVPVEADLFNFMAKIEAAQDLIPTVAHSIKYDEAQKATRQNNGGTSSTSNYQAPISNTEGLDGFPF
jgi:hypothetical protein